MAGDKMHWLYLKKMILDASWCTLLKLCDDANSFRKGLSRAIHEIDPVLPRISVAPHGFAKALNFTQIHLPISMAGPGFQGLIRVPSIVRTKNAGQNAEGLWILGAVYEFNKVQKKHIGLVKHYDSRPWLSITATKSSTSPNQKCH